MSYKHCCWAARRDKISAARVTIAYRPSWRLVNEIYVYYFLLFYSAFSGFLLNRPSLFAISAVSHYSAPQFVCLIFLLPFSSSRMFSSVTNVLIMIVLILS